MPARVLSQFRWVLLALVMGVLGAVCLTPHTAAGEDKKNEKLAEPIKKGQRVFTCGHSFHVWVPGILTDLAKKAEIPDHTQIGLSSIGGSRVIQHWDIADDKNKAKEALKTGKVDVLTLSPIFLPDEGIEKFTDLALEYNKDIRICVQKSSGLAQSSPAQSSGRSNASYRLALSCLSAQSFGRSNASNPFIPGTIGTAKFQ